MKKYLSEFIGTYGLVFCGTGAIVINDLSGGMVTHVGIAITFGLIVMSMIYAFGEISGAHLNPAVTIGFWMSGRFPKKEVAPYIVAQLLGGIFASLCLLLLFPTHEGLGTTLPAGSASQSFFLEIILTFFLMLVIINVSTGSKEVGMLAGMSIGAVVLLEALFAGPICGASMNPARSIAPALTSGQMQHLWIYITAPIVGALIAVIIWKILKKKSMKLLFVCIENSNRSQMAQAFAKMHGGENIEAYSAGSKPSGKINPRAIEAMAELNYDLSKHDSKSLDDIPQIQYDYVVSMGCGEKCPWVPAKQRLDWDIPDPKDMDRGEFRKVRELIQKKVIELL